MTGKIIFICMNGALKTYDMKTLTDKGEVKFNLVDLNKSQIGFIRIKFIIRYPTMKRIS